MTDPAREAAERIMRKYKYYPPDTQIPEFVVARAYLALPTAGDREALLDDLATFICNFTDNNPDWSPEDLARAILASGFRRDGVREA